MEFKSLKNIETSFRHLRLFGIVYLCACTLLVGYSVWKAYGFAEAQRQKIYVLDEGKSLMLALSQDLEQNRPVEAREHVRRFHELFFSLAPDKSAIEGNIQRAMFLSDRSAYAHHRDLAEQDKLQAQMEEIRGLMARHDGADLTDEYRTVESLRLDVASAHDRVKTLESGSRGLPDRLELETLQGRINALVSVDRAVAESKSRLELAVRAFRTAEAAMEAHPMAGKDPSQAASIPLNAPPRPKASPLFLVLALAAGLLTGLGFLPKPQIIAAVALFSVGTGAVFGVYPARLASRLHPVDALRHE